jgi:hypothetical protein
VGWLPSTHVLVGAMRFGIKFLSAMGEISAGIEVPQVVSAASLRGLELGHACKMKMPRS